MERWVSFWDQPESLFCGSWEQRLIYLCDYLGLSGAVREHGRWDEREGKEYQEVPAPQELLEMGLFMRRTSLEPSEQIRSQGRGKVRVGSCADWGCFSNNPMHQKQLCKINSMKGMSTTAGLSWDCSSSSSLQRGHSGKN